MERDRGYYREVAKRKALRRRRLDSEIYYGAPMYDNLHQYSKNKIHCSCSMCSAKTKNKGRRRYKHGNYSPSVNYKHSDLQKRDSMNAQIEDINCGYTQADEGDGLENR